MTTADRGAPSDRQIIPQIFFVAAGTILIFSAQLPRKFLCGALLQFLGKAIIFNDLIDESADSLFIGFY